MFFPAYICKICIDKKDALLYLIDRQQYSTNICSTCVVLNLLIVKGAAVTVQSNYNCTT